MTNTNMEFLMPSEVARLVLGYLKLSGCHATWESFLRESNDLKEYAECVRRGREYPTNIGGRNLVQLLDTGYGIVQSQVSGQNGSPVELMSALERITTRLKDVMSQVSSTNGQNNGRMPDAQQPVLHNSAHSGYGDCVQQATGVLPEQESRQHHSPLPASRTSATMGGVGSQATPSPLSNARLHQLDPRSNGNDTLNYRALLPSVPLLPPAMACALLKTPPLPKVLPQPLVKFEHPEKDLGASRSSHLCNLLEHISPSKSLLPGGFGRSAQASSKHDLPLLESAYEEGFLAYMNSLPRLPRPAYIDEEPVRDTGMDLSKRLPAGVRHSLDRQVQSVQNVTPQQTAAESQRDQSSFPTRSETSFNRQEAATSSCISVSPASEGFEVTEARTEGSEEIDVDGSSRGPSPPSSEEALADSSSAHKSDAPLACSISAEPAGAAATSAGLTSVPVSVSGAQTPGPQIISPAQNPVIMETPESTDAPPLPRRYPEPTSPRFILSQERSLVPSLTTPMKEVRFSADRFYSPRRKSLIPRRRILSYSSPSSKVPTETTESNSSEESREINAILHELLNNYPFVEKLAENINEVVRTDNVPCSSRQPLEPVPEDRPLKLRPALSSQDINLPDSVIRDILSKTENDPVFEEILSQMCGRLDTTSDAHRNTMTPKSKSSLTPRHRKENSCPTTPTQQCTFQCPSTPQLIKMINGSPTSSPLTSMLSRSPLSSPCGGVPATPGKTPPRTSANIASASLKTPPSGVTPLSRVTPPKPSIRVVSSTVEAGQTVACISIPDSSTPEVQQTISRNGNSCKTLSDVIDSVLTPENRLALTQPECAPTTVMTVAPTTAQQAVLIRQDGTQMVLCAAETVATQLQGSGEARIIYPPGTVVIESITSPCRLPSTRVGRVPKKPPLAKKRLPLLQPKDTPFSQPPPPAFKKLEKPTFSSVMRSRLKSMNHVNKMLKQGSASICNANLENATVVTASSSFPIQAAAGQLVHMLVPQLAPQPFLSSSTPQHVTTSGAHGHIFPIPNSRPGNSQQPTTAATTMTLICSGTIGNASGAKTSNARSPQLKSLVKVASKAVSSQRSHVRVLNFGGGLEESPPKNREEADLQEEVQEAENNVAETLVCIGTTLAGAVQKVFRNTAVQSKQGKSSECGMPPTPVELFSRKRNLQASKENKKAKKPRNEEYLKDMDVNKFLDKIHK